MRSGLAAFEAEMRSHRWKLPSGEIPYGMGCAYVGRTGEEGREEDVRTLLLAYESGCRAFDTSPVYGESEVRLGEFLREIDRETVLLSTKVEKSPIMFTEPERWIRESVAQSFERLGVSSVEVLLLHDLDFLALAEKDTENRIGAVVQELRSQGLIRYFGLGMRRHAYHRRGLQHDSIDCILSFSDLSPIEPSARSLLRECKAAGRGFFNGSPLAGFLNGTDPGLRTAHPTVEYRRLKAVEFYQFCVQRGVSTLAAALQFPLFLDPVDLNFTGPRNTGELRASLEALQTPLPDGFWEQWQAASGIAPRM